MRKIPRYCRQPDSNTVIQLVDSLSPLASANRNGSEQNGSPTKYEARTPPTADRLSWFGGQMATGSPILFDAQWKGLLIQFLTLGQHLMDLIRQHLFHDTFISKQKVEMVSLCFGYLWVVSHVSQQGQPVQIRSIGPITAMWPQFCPYICTTRCTLATAVLNMVTSGKGLDRALFILFIVPDLHCVAPSYE